MCESSYCSTTKSNNCLTGNNHQLQRRIVITPTGRFHPVLSVMIWLAWAASIESRIQGWYTYGEQPVDYAGPEIHTWWHASLGFAIMDLIVRKAIVSIPLFRMKRFSKLLSVLEGRCSTVASLLSTMAHCFVFNVLPMRLSANQQYVSTTVRWTLNSWQYHIAVYVSLLEVTSTVCLRALVLPA